MAPLLDSTIEVNVGDFHRSYTDEPHATRRKLITAKYPQVKQLMGPDPMLKWKIIAVVSIQVAMCKLIQDFNWWQIFLLTYMVGGTTNHAMTLAMHEVSHNLAFKKVLYNRLFGIFTNFPLGLPAFCSFKLYHSEHHRYQGEEGVDTDIPTRAEGRFFNNSAKKVLWVIMQPLFYAFRPLIVLPRTPSAWELINVVAQLAFNTIIWYFFGWAGVAYLVGGTLLGMGLHPMAGHFIAEHYCFVLGQETYSYYGPLNWFSFNVGYHNEHHDFPYIPGSRLPALRAMAPEFYDTLPCHTSWIKVIYNYITDPEVGPFSRVKRSSLSDEQRAALLGLSKTPTKQE